MLFVHFIIESKAIRNKKGSIQQKYGMIKLGITQEKVLTILGEPDEKCNISNISIHEGNIKDKSIIDELKKQTKEKWVYYFSDKRKHRKPCVAEYMDSEIGFNAKHEVIWYQPLTDETWLHYQN
jgi:hypothetical protein